MHWKGFFQAYRRLSKHEALTQAFGVAAIITIIIVFASNISDIEVLQILKKIAELAVSIFPSLTGLAFAGYTIVIGTISPDLRRLMSKRPENPQANSLLEDCNAVFSFMLLIAVITLFLSFLEIIIIECKWKTDNGYLANIVNISTLFILTYSVCISFRSMLSVILNVFNFGQYLEYDANKQKDTQPNQ